jgi:hypothetical protein
MSTPNKGPAPAEADSRAGLFRNLINPSDTESKTQNLGDDGVIMFYHPDGWLRREEYKKGPGSQEDKDPLINVKVKFERSDSGRDPFRKVDDPNPMTALNRRYEDEWGMVSGEPQIWKQHDGIWPGLYQFVARMHQIEGSEAMSELIGDGNQTTKCVLCNETLKLQRVYRFVHYQWNNTFVEHYLRMHFVMPSARMYETVREITGKLLYINAFNQYQHDCDQAKNELGRVLLVKSIDELKMLGPEAAKLVRPVYPPAFFFRHSLWKEDTKTFVEVNRDQLVVLSNHSNEGLRKYLQDPVKWKEDINKGITEPDQLRDFAATVSGLDKQAKSDIIEMRRKGPAKLKKLAQALSAKKPQSGSAKK